MLFIAFGMTCAVAQLTTTVHASVKAVHTGVASNINSAVARTGGPIATVLLSLARATRGGALLASFHVAAMLARDAAMTACICTFVWIKATLVSTCPKESCFQHGASVISVPA